MFKKFFNNIRYIAKSRKPGVLIFEILFILAIFTPFSFAQNLTPGTGYNAHTGYTFAPFAWWNGSSEEEFRKNVGAGTGQQYAIIEYIESSAPNPSPTVATVNAFKLMISSSLAGVLFIATHGGCNTLAIESYAGTALGLAARNAQYEDYINNQGYAADEIFKGFESAPTQYYTIQIFPKFLTQYGNLPQSLVYVGACKGWSWTDDFVGIGARVAVGNSGSPTIQEQKDRVKHFFEDMNGVRGIANRPVAQAMQGQTLTSNGNTATTLAPAISSHSKTGDDPYCVKAGETVTFVYDTTSEQWGTPDILTNKSTNVTLNNVQWVNNVTLTADVVAVTGDPVTLVVDWEESWSDQNEARLDGNTNPWGTNARGPAHDDYMLRLYCEEQTAINLVSFTATEVNGDVVLDWVTATEIDNAGFNIWRKEGTNGQEVKINDTLIPANGSLTAGAFYSYTDNTVVAGNTYYYQLEDIETNGTNTLHDTTDGVQSIAIGSGNGSSASAGGGGCFIATAAYGSYLDPHVYILREFRDQYLLTNSPGTKFVDLYYQYSRPVADFIAEHEFLRAITRVLLLPLIGFGAFLVKTTAIQKMISMFILLAMTVSLIVVRRKRLEG